MSIHRPGVLLRRSPSRSLLLGLFAALVFATAATSIKSQARADTSSNPVPLYSQWTPTTQVFQNADGTLTADVSSSPIQAPDPASPTG